MSDTVKPDIFDETDTILDANDDQPWARPRGSVTKNGRVIIGRVGAPPQHEATSGQFAFWVPEEVLVEDTQLVTCESKVAGQSFTYYALIESVRRRSKERSISDGVTEADGDLTYEPPFTIDGCTYAIASILRIEPPMLTPPRERSEVFLAGPNEASIAYSTDEMGQPLAVGLIKNGGSNFAGSGCIDLDYLLGVNGGHMNVNGSAGRGTKSSLLLHMNYLLLHKARQQQRERPSDPSRLRVVPIILNVKNFDLFHIDTRNNRYKQEDHLNEWHLLNIDNPGPFQNVTFLAPQQANNAAPVPTGRHSDVQPYSWSLRDVIARGLLPYLFAESDTNDVNFGALVLDIENRLTDEQVNNDSTITRTLRSGRLPEETFQGLLDWVNQQARQKDDDRALRNHHSSTWKKLHRRLIKIIYEGAGVLRRNDLHGHPLNLVRADTSDPIVVDLAALAGEPSLQRFVVATIFRQLVEARTGVNAVKGLVYLVTLDELNRFAPRGAHDPITQLIETIAAEMRSQGIILFGAQQQASKVSDKVIENAAIRVLGRSGSLELNTTPWRFLSQSARQKAENLSLNEKLFIQDNFREPMHVRVPFPVWALNPREASAPTGVNGTDDYADIIDE